MSDPLSSAFNLASNTIGNATSSLVSGVSDGVINGTTTAITGLQKCIYQSTFVSVIDKNKYGIVSNSMDGLNSVGCICQNEDNSSTNEKAINIYSCSIFLRRNGFSTKDRS